MSHNTPSRVDIPERVDGDGSSIVDKDNDLVLRSRRGHYVDMNDAMRGPRGRILGARAIDSPEGAERSFDSEKSDLGNAGIGAYDTLTRSDRW